MPGASTTAQQAGDMAARRIIARIHDDLGFWLRKLIAGAGINPETAWSQRISYRILLLSTVIILEMLFYRRFHL